MKRIETFQTAIDANTPLLLTIDGELLRYLDNP